MEIRKDIFKVIQHEKEYKNLLASYKKLNNLIEKGPIENLINIRKNVENFKSEYEKIVSGTLIKPERHSYVKSEISKINVDSLNNRMVKELREICKRNGITGYSKANKSNLITKIKDSVDSLTPKVENYNQQVEKELENYIQALTLKVSQWREDFRRDFLNNLEKLLKVRKFELKGTLPVLKTWLFSFNIDFDRLTVSVWYGPEQERIANFKLDYNFLVEKIDNYYEFIVSREFNENTFLKRIYRAYKILIFKQERNEEDQVPIIDLLLEYIFIIQSNRYKANPRKEFYTDYPRYLFSYDLFKLRKRKHQNYELTPIIATRAYTKKLSDFLWIPTNDKGDGNYISHIKFREIRNE